MYGEIADPVSRQVYAVENNIITVGAGYLDIAGALDENDAAPAGLHALSPIAELNEAAGEVALLTGESVLWGRSGAGGASVLWGRDSPYADSVARGRDVNATGILIHGDE